MDNKGKSLLKKKQYLRWFWWFIWEDDSIWSWIVTALLAFILIKFMIYPVLGFMMGTTHPIVAVVSGSMEHDGSFDDWWNDHHTFYEGFGITEQQFKEFPFKNGFNTGDIMVLYGKSPEDIDVGDVMVYYSYRPDPIIHRVVDIKEDNNSYHYQTKGDHNLASNFDEMDINPDMLTGHERYKKGSVAAFRIPYLGWIKIAFVKLITLFRG